MPPAAPLALNGGPPPPHHSPTVGPAAGQAPANGAPLPPTLAKLVSANEETWLLIGKAHDTRDRSLLPWRLKKGHPSFQGASQSRWAISNMR
jgi:hypothetical protein